MVISTFILIPGPPQPPLPEGPFNPTNYSGTQINVWGAPPGSWPGMNANNGAVTFGVPVPNNPYPTQTGFLTENMISVSRVMKYVVFAYWRTEKFFDFVLTLDDED